MTSKSLQVPLPTNTAVQENLQVSLSRELGGHLEASQAREESKEVAESRSVHRKGLRLVLVHQLETNENSDVRGRPHAGRDAEGRRADAPSSPPAPTQALRTYVPPREWGCGEGLLTQLSLNLE